MSNNLQKMIVIPSNVFEQWKTIEDEKLTELDKSMKKILFNSKLDNITKWNQYKEILYKFSGKYDHKLKEMNRPVSSEKDTQTKFCFKSNKKSQTECASSNKETQVNFQRKGDIYGDDVFESIPSELSENHPDIQKNNEETNIEDDIDYDYVRKAALEGTTSDVGILREKDSKNSAEYKLVELTNGEIVTVPTRRMTRSKVKEEASKIMPHSKNNCNQKNEPFPKWAKYN